MGPTWLFAQAPPELDRKVPRQLVLVIVQLAPNRACIWQSRSPAPRSCNRDRRRSGWFFQRAQLSSTSSKRLRSRELAKREAAMRVPPRQSGEWSNAHARFAKCAEPLRFQHAIRQVPQSAPQFPDRVVYEQEFLDARLLLRVIAMHQRLHQ